VRTPSFHFLKGKDYDPHPQRGGCATHRRQITKKRNQNLHNQEWLCHNVVERARWSWFWVVSVSSLGCAPRGVAVPQRRYYWALRCAIVVPRRFALRRTDESACATPTGRRRYGGFTRPSEKLGEPRCDGDTWGTHFAALSDPVA
jgi:hypothetical protein